MDRHTGEYRNSSLKDVGEDGLQVRKTIPGISGSVHDRHRGETSQGAGNLCPLGCVGDRPTYIGGAELLWGTYTPAVCRQEGIVGEGAFPPARGTDVDGTERNPLHRYQRGDTQSEHMHKPKFWGYGVRPALAEGFGGILRVQLCQQAQGAAEPLPVGDGIRLKQLLPDRPSSVWQCGHGPPRHSHSRYVGDQQGCHAVPGVCLSARYHV